MPVEFLKFKKDKGVVSIKVQIDNVPIWNYLYKEDSEYENDTAQNDPMEHTLGKPHELKRPIHEWRFILTNPASFEITASVRIQWFQEVDGQVKQIHSWKEDSVKIKAEKGEIVGSQVILLAS